jgi:hypothetical protein
MDQTAMDPGMPSLTVHTNALPVTVLSGFLG